MRGGGVYKKYKIIFYLLFDCSILTKDIAPLPISKTKPIVRTIKNTIPIVNPKIDT